MTKSAIIRDYTTGSIAMFMTMIGMGFSNSGQIYIAQLIGAGPNKESACDISNLHECAVYTSFRSVHNQGPPDFVHPAERFLLHRNALQHSDATRYFL